MILTLIEKAKTLFANEPTDVVNAIKLDHDALRNYIGTLKDGHKPLAERRKAYDDFSALLKSHSMAEEEAVYASVEDIPKKDLKIEIAEGYVEHQVAEDLMKTMESVTDAREWGAHANVLAEIVEHHLKEEEEELLPLIQEAAPKSLNEAMLAAYVDLRYASQQKVTEDNAGVLDHV